MDRYLDTTRKGPMYLRQEVIAQLVEEAIYRGTALEHYMLHAYVIMANHVHMLVSPLVNPSRFMQSLKGFTGRQANKVLARTGEPFWQAESYDHWVRNSREWQRIRYYIENNPVRAGFATSAENYRWSSAYHSNPGILKR